MVPKNYKSSAFWERKAAENGDSASQLRLGNMYSKGLGVSQSLQDAYFWYLISSAQGNSGATKERDQIESQLNQKQITQMQTKARNWVANSQKIEKKTKA